MQQVKSFKGAKNITQAHATKHVHMLSDKLYYSPHIRRGILEIYTSGSKKKKTNPGRPGQKKLSSGRQTIFINWCRLNSPIPSSPLKNK